MSEQRGNYLSHTCTAHTSDRAEDDEHRALLERRERLKSAIGRLKPDVKNALLLQAVTHYTQVRLARDSLLVRIGLLDPPFAELILRLVNIT